MRPPIHSRAWQPVFPSESASSGWEVTRTRASLSNDLFLTAI